MKILALATAAGATLAFATAASAHPAWQDQGRSDWNYGYGYPAYAQNWTPPGLAKKPHGMPPGQAKKIYGRGEYLPRDYYGNDNYYLGNYNTYGLRPPPPGYRWVRVGNEVYLAQTKSGLIAEVISDLFN